MLHVYLFVVLVTVDEHAQSPRLVYESVCEELQKVVTLGGIDGCCYLFLLVVMRYRFDDFLPDIGYTLL